MLAFLYHFLTSQKSDENFYDELYFYHAENNPAVEVYI